MKPFVQKLYRFSPIDPFCIFLTEGTAIHKLTPFVFLRNCEPSNMWVPVCSSQAGTVQLTRKI